MTTTVLPDVIARLDLAVFEQVAEGVFLRLAPAGPPGWLSEVLPEAPRNAPMVLAQAFPFLERFMGDAERLWHDGAGPRVRSDVFTSPGASGRDVAIVATAIAVDARRFLVLESPAAFAEWQRALQCARDQALGHEDHLRRTAALRGPVEAAQQLVHRLSSGEVSAEQRQVVDALTAQLARLLAEIEALAPLPKGVRPERR